MGLHVSRVRDFEVQLLSDAFVVAVQQRDVPKVVEQVEPGRQVVDAPALRADQFLQLHFLVLQLHFAACRTLATDPPETFSSLVASPEESNLTALSRPRCREFACKLGVASCLLVEQTHDALQDIRLQLRHRRVRWHCDQFVKAGVRGEPQRELDQDWGFELREAAPVKERDLCENTLRNGVQPLKWTVRLQKLELLNKFLV